MDRRRTQPGSRMGRRKMPLATQQGRCRNTLHHWKNFCATLSKVGRIPRWLSRWASAGSSAVWADIRTIGERLQLTLARKGAISNVSVEVTPAVETTGKVYSSRQQ